MAKYKRGGVPFKPGTRFKRVFSPSIDDSRGDKDSRPGTNSSNLSPVLDKNELPILSSSEELSLPLVVTVDNMEKEVTTFGEPENGQENANGEGSADSKKDQVIGLSHLQLVQDSRRECVLIRRIEHITSLLSRRRCLL